MADATVAEVQKRFGERSLVLCGDEFIAVKVRPEDVAPKMNLLNCVHSKVCEAVFARLQACAAARESDGDAATACAAHRQALMLCVKAAYSSLPPPETSPADVRRSRDALLSGSNAS